jgi:hypothetical protein
MVKAGFTEKLRYPTKGVHQKVKIYVARRAGFSNDASTDGERR